MRFFDRFKQRNKPQAGQHETRRLTTPKPVPSSGGSPSSTDLLSQRLCSPDTSADALRALLATGPSVAPLLLTTVQRLKAELDTRPNQEWKFKIDLCGRIAEALAQLRAFDVLC